jgi:hypothetical protein
MRQVEFRCSLLAAPAPFPQFWEHTGSARAAFTATS